MGADYSVVDAMAGVHLCQKIMTDLPMGR